MLLIFLMTTLTFLFFGFLAPGLLDSEATTPRARSSLTQITPVTARNHPLCFSNGGRAHCKIAMLDAGSTTRKLPERCFWEEVVARSINHFSTVPEVCIVVVDATGHNFDDTGHLPTSILLRKCIASERGRSISSTKNSLLRCAKRYI